MHEILSILKVLATSNTINFIIMVVILVVIIKKLSIGSMLDKAINSISLAIDKSDEQKKSSIKVLEKARDLVDRLPQDVSELENVSKNKISVFTSKLEHNANVAISTMEQNVDRVMNIEEKKVANLLTEVTAKDSIELAKTNIIDRLKNNPELHNIFIQNSLEELEKVEL